ncbi:MAG: OprD family outer membrane porin, partial [Sediminibacterium sp.]|nr:OprD family outer membrane porin [Sediminibacterium sp.]
DPTTGLGSRYETNLFDIEDPNNKKDLDRLEEFYLKYNFKKSNITIGRQLINTPFINLQDGRMRPTGVEGVWVNLNEFKKIQLEAGILNAISPRGTVKWYGVGESIGIYPSGVNADGSKAGYPGNVEASNLIQVGIHHTISKKATLHAWNLVVPKVFNSALLQLDFTLPAQEKDHQYYGSLQAVKQHALQDGGNEDPAKRFIEKDNGSFSYGARVGYKTPIWDLSLNYNRITKEGRYLMPREWGRDPFFTFMPRERNEGFGDVHGVVAKAAYSIPQKRLKLNVAGGYFKLPDVRNTQLNKFGMPSYMQVNLDVRYAFAGMFQGMDAQVLIVGKWNQGDLYQQAKYELNKVNMVLYNFVLNYHF